MVWTPSTLLCFIHSPDRRLYRLNRSSRIFLKLENLQPSGSFKSRGIGHFLQTHLRNSPKSTSADGNKTHFYSSSGGNAGLACVVAARQLNHPATVVVPLSTNPMMMAKIKAAGASEVIQHGASWKDADTYLREVVLKNDPKGVYVPPFDHPDIWEGHSSIVEEMYAQLGNSDKINSVVNGFREEKPDAIVCSVGGGGLLCGVMQGLEIVGWEDVPVLALETKGADSLSSSLKAGELVTLPGITSLATTLGATRVAERAFELARKPNVRSVVLSDSEAAMGCWRLADDQRVMVEMACGVNVALCYEGRLEQALGKKLSKESKVVIVLCGGSNVTLDMLADWRKQFGEVENALDKSMEVPSSQTAPA